MEGRESQILEAQAAVLDFWFGAPPLAASTYAQRRKVWFGKQPDFDATIQQQFRAVYDQAAAGALHSWQQTPSGCLALILVLDQFSRNMFRDTPNAFATDPQALEIAQFSVERGFDLTMEPIQQVFVYLPFEHSEDRHHQAQSVQFFQQIVDQDPGLTDVLDYALRHQAVIEQFGRFPHRNRILGRTSTPEEAEFLQQPGSAF